MINNICSYMQVRFVLKTNLEIYLKVTSPMGVASVGRLAKWKVASFGNTYGKFRSSNKEKHKDSIFIRVRRRFHEKIKILSYWCFDKRSDKCYPIV